MAPEGGELARSCAPATHNRVLRLHTQTRPSRGARATANVLSLYVRTYVRIYTRGTVPPVYCVCVARFSLPTCTLGPKYLCVRVLVSRIERIVRRVQRDACLFHRVSGLSVSLSVCAWPSCRRERVPAPVRTCVREQDREGKTSARGTEKGKTRRERGQRRERVRTRE